MAKNMCKVCGQRPATVPDRRQIGRMINMVCSRCHALRLAGDMAEIMRLTKENTKARGE